MRGTLGRAMVGAASGRVALSSRRTQSENATLGWEMVSVASVSAMASDPAVAALDAALGETAGATMVAACTTVVACTVAACTTAECP